MTTNTNAALPDAVRVPLDSLHADASYLIGRLQRGTMTAGRVVEVIRERIDAAKAALTTAAAVPAEGWVMVPVEPTKEMIEHAHHACDGTYAGDVYRAMVSAAPKAEPVQACHHCADRRWGIPPCPVHADRAMRAQAAPTPSEWDVRGRLAASLTCWHRLTGQEAAELVALFQGHPAQAAPAAVAHIQQPYTLAEIKAKIASGSYSAELLLQHAMLLLDKPAAVAGPSRDLHPEKCPITGRPFFMVLDHPELGPVPTYGGPFDSYTIPAPEGEPTDPWHERELRCERFDHDAGYWVEGGEPIPLRIVHDDVLDQLQSDAAAPTTQAAPQPAVQQGDDFGSAEHWKEKAQYWAGVAHNLRQQALRGEPVDGIIPPAAPVAQGDALTQAARDVLAERQRQISAEGWTPANDDGHEPGSLSEAAGCYAMQAYGSKQLPALWPWAIAWWKPSDDPRRNLEKAGALILAEMERIDRAAARSQAKEGA